MASIKISDLNPAGYDLFSDSEGYMNELSDGELSVIYGGIGWGKKLLISVTVATIIASATVVTTATITVISVATAAA